MTNKPEVVGFLMQSDFQEPYVSLSRDSSADHVEPLIRQSDHIAEVSKMVGALEEARDALAIALRVGAPDWYPTHESISSHSTIKLIDEALGGAG